MLLELLILDEMQNRHRKPKKSRWIWYTIIIFTIVITIGASDA